MSDDLVEVGVDRIVINRERRPFVVLTDPERRRVLPIPIGLAEAAAIYHELDGQKFPRPLTHDLVASVLGHLDVELEQVAVTEFRGGTFYALMEIQTDGDTKRVDARPSDAIAVALRMRARVLVSESVLQQAGMPMDQDLDEAGADDDDRRKEIDQFRLLLEDADLDEQ